MIDGIINNLMDIKNENYCDIENKIIEAFENYTYKGEFEIIVSSPNEMNCFRPSEGVHCCYINAINAPITYFSLKENDDKTFSIINAWE